MLGIFFLHKKSETGLIQILITIMLMDYISTIFAQATAAPAEAPQGGGTSMLLFIVLMFAAMYFLMIAPQRKKQKAHAKMISELKTGDEVMTIGGACGTIANVKEKTFVVKFADGVKIEFIKSAISEKVSGDSDNSQKK